MANPTTPPPADLACHTKAYIEALYDPEELLCLTMLDGEKHGKVTEGFYRDRQRFLIDSQLLNGTGCIYINLNRIDPDLYGRAADRYKSWRKSRYSGQEVVWRPRLCIDLDPVRLSGINSTEDELKAALDLAPEVAEYVTREYDETPLITQSGNGVQMIVKINEPPDSELPEQFLKHLDEKFSTEKVHVDTSCHDLPRLVRLPGCLNCKGDDIPERPRRYSLILGAANAA